jgi:3'-phosphoadenosine 5'-phosphosulfate sulfotransferase (PAPS reductase)/FAD synthetase
MDSVAMTHYVHDDLPGRTRPRVVYLDTTVGNPAQRVYVQALSDHYNWQLHTIRTESDFVDTTEKYDFYGPSDSAHQNIFQKLKGRQIDGLTTIAEDPHFYWGTYRAESPQREKLVVEEWTDDRGAVHHAPLHDKDEQWVRDYLVENEVRYGRLPAERRAFTRFVDSSVGEHELFDGGAYKPAVVATDVEEETLDATRREEALRE